MKNAHFRPELGQAKAPLGALRDEAIPAKVAVIFINPFLNPLLPPPSPRFPSVGHYLLSGAMTAVMVMAPLGVSECRSR